MQLSLSFFQVPNAATNGHYNFENLYHIQFQQLCRGLVFQCLQSRDAGNLDSQKFKKKMFSFYLWLACHLCRSTLLVVCRPVYIHSFKYTHLCDYAQETQAQHSTHECRVKSDQFLKCIKDTCELKWLGHVCQQCLKLQL